MQVYRNLLKILQTILLLFLITGASQAFSFKNVTTDMLSNISTYIDFDVSDPASCYIEWGTTTSYGNYAYDSNFTAWWHYIKLEGLAPSTTYHYRIHCTDWQGNSYISQDYTCTTLSNTEVENRIKVNRADGGLPKTYYIAPWGNDSNDGLSLSTAWKTLTYAIPQLDAGDTLYIVNGTYYETGLLEFQHSGIPEAPIKVLAYNGTPTFNTQSTQNFEIRFHNYTIIEGLKMVSNWTDAFSEQVSVNSSNSLGPYSLTYNRVINNSETLRIGATIYIRNVDYIFDYINGTFTVINGSNLYNDTLTNTTVNISYEYYLWAQGTSGWVGISASARDHHNFIKNIYIDSPEAGVQLGGIGAHHYILKDSYINGSSYNTIYIWGDQYGSSIDDGQTAYKMLIMNNTVLNNDEHNGVNLAGNVSFINIVANNIIIAHDRIIFTNQMAMGRNISVVNNYMSNPDHYGVTISAGLSTCPFEIYFSNNTMDDIKYGSELYGISY